MKISIRTMGLAAVLLLLLLSTHILNAADEPKAKPAADTSAKTVDSAYASDDACQACHSELWEKHFASTPHRALLSGDQHGCQGCHGPGQAHIDGGGDKTKIIRFETLNPAQTAAICTQVPPGQHGDAELLEVRTPGQRRKLH